MSFYWLSFWHGILLDIILIAAKCRSAKCHYSLCCSAKCHSAECRVTIISTMTNLNRSRTAMKFEKKCLLRKIINSHTTFYLVSQSPSANFQNSSKTLSCMGAKLSPTPTKQAPFPLIRWRVSWNPLQLQLILSWSKLECLSLSVTLTLV
jgi:hypothetical protein